MSEISELAEFITTLKLPDISQNVQKEAVLRILDTIGTAIGASDSGQIRAVSDQWTEMDRNQRVSVWGQNRRAGLSTAVFLNAMMAHTQEMDDVHTGSKTHIGTVVVPAAWGLAQALGASGKECLEAVICGYEVMSRIGMGFGVSVHRNKGWHVTATAGTFGAAAACARLLKLNKQQTVYALGLAGAQSFGTWAFLGDGATCKVLNPARASQVGMEAAILAKTGMTGPEHILTAEDGGLFRMMSDGGDIGPVTEALGRVWQLLYMDQKPYPSCRSTHCAIDGALALCREYGLKAEQVEKVEVETYLVGYRQCGLSQISQKPRTPVHARFSTPYTVACAILYGEVTLRQFRPEMICDPAVQSLLKRVTVEAADEFTRIYPAHWGCRVRIHDIYEKVYETCVKDASGSVARPLGQEQVKAKAAALMKEVCGSQAVRIAETVLDIENLDILPQL